MCATLLDLKGALFGRGEAVALSTFLGNLCGAMCTRAALLASPAEDLEAAIEAAQMVYGQGRDGSPAPLLQVSAEELKMCKVRTRVLFLLRGRRVRG